MRYFEITFPHNTTLVISSNTDVYAVLGALRETAGILSPTGTIYNPKAYQTLNEVLYPTEQLVRLSQPIGNAFL